MRVHYIQHISFEGLGHMETWLTENNHAVTATQVWMNNSFPAMEDFDLLIIMGGPMSTDDDQKYTWLAAEKRFISDAINAGKKLIGVCLGAQLIAAVSGARVYPNRHLEIGWFPVRFKPSFATWLGADTPDTLTVFHWHGDTFDLPQGAENGAGSEACTQQLFTYGENIIGLQFHLEATPQTISLMLENESADLMDGPFVQDKQQILNNTNCFAGANSLMEKILGKLCRE